MTALAYWAPGALLGSSVLMLFVLVVRLPVHRWISPRLGYALWALPALRMIVPSLPVSLAGMPLAANTSAKLVVLVVGAPGSGLWPDPATRWPLALLLLAVWLTGAAALLGVQVARYLRFRHEVLASTRHLGWRGPVAVVAAAVDGPLAFGVLRPTIAVPHDFAAHYDARQQELALAHEAAHHSRGDLVANWAALVMLALHWWNPVAWIAVRAFREDQEFAVDAQVLAHSAPGTRPAYAAVLAKAAGLGTLAVCTLNPRSNLKGRLTMLVRQPTTTRRLILGGGSLVLAGAAALVATVPVSSAAAPAAGRQAVTIGVKPDGAGGYAVIVGGKAAAAGAPLPGGAALPADFSPHGGCDLTPAAKPYAMVIKGQGGTTTYTVMCASAAPAPVRATLGEGLASLKTMRAMVASQSASPQFPEAERRHALGGIDRSIGEVEGSLGKAS